MMKRREGKKGGIKKKREGVRNTDGGMHTCCTARNSVKDH